MSALQRQGASVPTEPASPPVVGWRPIATAPKAVVILGWGENELFPAPMAWDWFDPATEKRSGASWEYADHLLRKEAGSVNPTHWMPLPAPPFA